MDKNGSALVIVLIFSFVLGVLGISLLKLSATDTINTRRQIQQQKSFFLAESGLQRATWAIKQDTAGTMANLGYTNTFTFSLKGTGTAQNSLENENISYTITYLGNETYQIASTSQFGGASKTLNSIVEENSSGKVFDYSYFINNWGWFYGSPIYAYGDVRSNGPFDFKYTPTVEGEIYSAYEITIDGSINGYGNQAQYQHPYSNSIPMPNLNDLSYYEGTATGSVVINGSSIINGIHGDDAGESDNIVLVGTATNPIEINGIVVVRGDVIVSGVVTGQGTIYAGRNLYIPNNITYADGPATNKPTYPGGGPPSDATINTWVSNGQSKDLVGFAATENIVLGDYTDSGNQWIFNNYLYGMGSEDVGLDGIPDSFDSGEGDGNFNAQFEDLDGDGTMDNDYVFSDLDTQVPLSNFDNLPANMSSYGDIVTNPNTYVPNTTTIEGIFYTNHAVAGTPEGNVTVNGSLVSKDEALGISSLTMNYDWRVHSNYTSGGNSLIDLPVAVKVDTLRWW